MKWLIFLLGLSLFLACSNSSGYEIEIADFEFNNDAMTIGTIFVHIPEAVCLHTEIAFTQSGRLQILGPTHCYGESLNMSELDRSIILELLVREAPPFL